MDKYYFDLSFVIADLIALITAMIVMIYMGVDNYFLRKELKQAYNEIDKLQPPFQVVELSTKWADAVGRVVYVSCEVYHIS